MATRWTMRNTSSKKSGCGHWLVQVLDDEQQVRKYMTERMETKKRAMLRASALNAQGYNVSVLFEHAYCENTGD